MQIDGLRLNTPVDNERIAEVRLMVLETMIDKVALSSVPHALAVHSEKNPVDPDSGCVYARCFQIKLPIMSQVDVEALTEELSLLGDLTVSSSSAEQTILDLWTNDGSPEILALCSFILDPDEVHINETSGDSLLSKDAHGVAQSQESEDSGFGFLIHTHSLSRR